MLRPLRMCRRRLERDGSGRRAVCHQRCLGHQRSRPLAAISRLRNARRSRFCEREAAACRTLHVRSGERRRRSLASYGVTPPPAVAAWSIVRRRRNGTRSGRLVGQSRLSSRLTRPCGSMCKRAWPAWLSLQAASLFPAPQHHGRGVDMDGGKTADGRKPGALNRLPDGCRSTFQVT